MLLAQRLVKSQTDALQLQQQLASVTTAKEQLETRVQQLHDQLAHLHQPQHYLIEKLAAKDAELHKQARKVYKLQTHLNELRGEYQELLEAKSALQRQLQHVLARRQDIDSLKHTVQHLLRDSNLAAVANHQQHQHQQHSVAPWRASSPALQATVAAVESPSHQVDARLTTPPPSASKRNNSIGNSSSESPTVNANTTGPKWYTKLR